ncbi:SCO6745 family protein [Pseudonocardia abyssalis]|uniref:SalK n=1 Tax=Pseudonocardia abyssalis TaxID=2792008 RepID=A0ABS6UUA4_9PSEU|nr:hypothetical protein [Pseudonocardia abyssalis]MBW0114706.1 hypothetical protein [Pseudonocardia abyssalis]MBW0135832.1 hypothetical protein [Pseudonocardia abyssalis]
MADQHEHRARRMWRAVEPIHAVTYFAPESKAVCDALGTRGYWMSYFGLRAAPLGTAPPELVTALFYNFHPAHVARAVPDVWAVAPPERYLAARLEAVDAALRRLVGSEVLAGPEVAEAAAIARDAALAAPTAGRALAAANAALPWPEAPHLVLWQAQTVLREHRGDGHVAALLTAGLDPLEALVVFAADQGLDAAALRLRRGWSEREWDAAAARLADRDLLDRSGALTDEGRLLRAEVEAHTDALADVAWLAVGAERAERLVVLAAPLVAALAAGDGFMPENPMGLRLLPVAG